MERADSTQGEVARLVVAAGEGDRGAESVLCARFAPAVRVFARRRLGAAAADDFCQETLLVFVRALRERRIERPESAGSFVLGICKNLARAGARAAERHPHVPGLDLLPDLREALREVDARISYWHVEDCLSRVTERARQVLRGRFEAEEPDARIAARLGLSEPNVRVLRHRTLAFLRECLEGA